MTKIINRRHLKSKVHVSRTKEMLNFFDGPARRFRLISSDMLGIYLGFFVLGDSIPLEDLEASTVEEESDGPVTVLSRAKDFDIALVNAYLNTETQSLHPRRTLDQSYYHMLNDIEKRDSDQVVDRWAQKSTRLESKRQKYDLNDNRDEDVAEVSQAMEEADRETLSHSRYVFMVDQLWLWVLHGSEYPDYSLLYPILS